MRRLTRAGLASLVMIQVTVSACAATGGSAPADYRTEIESWRKAREERLKSDTGWLTVAGLFWLKEGDNTFGSDLSSDIVLPAGSSPASVGVLKHQAGVTKLEVRPGVTVTLDGQPVTARELRPDSSGSPDIIAINDLTLHVIHRGERYAIRLRDKNSKMRKEFTALSWYPVKESYRVTARFVANDPPRQIPVPNIIGIVEPMPSPGYAVFSLDGREVRLNPVLEEPGADQLFYIFSDATNGAESYPSGRFLYSDMPKDGVVVLDFNKAYTPPCAFTPYATCPLPPEENRLPVRIEAGELKYGDH